VLGAEAARSSKEARGSGHGSRCSEGGRVFEESPKNSEREAKRAQKQVELWVKAMKGKETGRPWKKKAPLKPGDSRNPQKPQNAYKQSVSR
jgi:hypothetical protein